jgi:arabinogalactan endo-1,4-beta-galactosidase
MKFRAGTVVILASLGLLAVPLTRAQEYAIGADVSFAAQAEQAAPFKDAGQPEPVLEILKNHGYNWVRLRIFVSPETETGGEKLPNNLEYTLASAKAARAAGFKILLDFHYSDTWADPGHQVTPKAWATKSHTELVQAVFEYTRDTLTAFREQGLLPDMVQVGNEITAGMMWPDGKLPEHWDNFADLVRAGVQGVYAGRRDQPRPKIMIHVDRGGDWKSTEAFFTKFDSYNIPYDVIGQSYYPWWHGSLLALRENLINTANRFHKDIYVVETAYNWRPGNYVTHPGPFPETPQGQHDFLEELQRVLLSVPNDRVKGVFWWEPAVSPGPIAGRGFFDDGQNALPVVTVFDRWTRK